MLLAGNHEYLPYRYTLYQEWKRQKRVSTIPISILS